MDGGRVDGKRVFKLLAAQKNANNKFEYFPQDSTFILKVAGDRFRMLPRDQTGSGSTEKVQSGEFLDRLILKNVVPQDSGMYICFVTSNGIGQLTYKAVHLNVLPSKFHWTCFCWRD